MRQFERTIIIDSSPQAAVGFPFRVRRDAWSCQTLMRFRRFVISEWVFSNPEFLVCLGLFLVVVGFRLQSTT